MDFFFSGPDVRCVVLHLTRRSSPGLARAASLVVLGLLSLSACSHSELDARNAVYVQALLDPKTDAETAEGYAKAAVRAQEIIDEFAFRNGWITHTARPLYSAFEVYDDRAALFARFLELNALPSDTPEPSPGLVAALDQGVLLALEPEAAKALRPEHFVDQDGWARLLAHEIFHRLHVRIVDGQDERMGPDWFIEGLAVVAAGQTKTTAATFRSVRDALASAKDRGPGASARYGAVVGWLGYKVPFSDLVPRAAEPGFEGWLSSLDSPASRPASKPAAVEPAPMEPTVASPEPSEAE